MAEISTIIAKPNKNEVMAEINTIKPNKNEVKS